MITATFGGKLVGAQRWSIAFNFQTAASTPSAEAMNTLANQLLSDFTNQLWTPSGGTVPLAGLVGTRGNLDSCRTYYKNAPASQAQVVGASTTAASNGTGTVTAAPQISIVATLLTGLAGRSYRGRVYLPGSATTDANGVFSGTVASGLATEVANALSAMALRAIGGQVLIPIVASATRNDQTPITVVRVDNVLDTQRRRRDKLTPTASGQATIVTG